MNDSDFELSISNRELLRVGHPVTLDEYSFPGLAREEMAAVAKILTGIVPIQEVTWSSGTPAVEVVQLEATELVLKAMRKAGYARKKQGDRYYFTAPSGSVIRYSTITRQFISIHLGTRAPDDLLAILPWGAKLLPDSTTRDIGMWWDGVVGVDLQWKLRHDFDYTDPNKGEYRRDHRLWGADVTVLVTVSPTMHGCAASVTIEPQAGTEPPRALKVHKP